jgi:hypothetical protein
VWNATAQGAAGRTFLSDSNKLLSSNEVRFEQVMSFTFRILWSTASNAAERSSSRRMTHLSSSIAHSISVRSYIICELMRKWKLTIIKDIIEKYISPKYYIYQGQWILVNMYLDFVSVNIHQHLLHLRQIIVKYILYLHILWYIGSIAYKHWFYNANLIENIYVVSSLLCFWNINVLLLYWFGQRSV